MKVKRRTVWLLTLFSLAAVISVYYVFEGNRDVNLSTVFTDDPLEQTTLTGVDQLTNTSTSTESYLFDDLRIQVSTERSQLRTQLTNKMASNEFTTEEKNEAFNQMNQLIKQESSEAMLEMIIKSLGYSDAFVRVEPDKVQVQVLSNELSTKQANDIVFKVRQEVEDMGITNVTVGFESSYY
ncbi:SpoIIIAH-like family protein [Ureibacillus manganicus]|uniref:Stage III sporulation protein AH n=1 Tax=Ureibacillus manganicus DSM 26584 TaxID=1384049 RepID=A0A0A3I4G5_9BACL|nr:SpoIIIAH-like family protein [Ureibacillus manganicus]KGR78400.1 stage III sporulation protein AH [Ureibacillus manganicus DSM 26584]